MAEGSVPDIRNLLGLDCQIQAMNRRIWQSGGSNVAKILGQTRGGVWPVQNL
jgi:hypothetical protein